MILFVGDEPSPMMKPGAKPFEGAACEGRLKYWINVLMDTRTDTYKIVNQVDKDLLEHLVLATIYKCPIISLGNAAHKKLCKLGYESFKLPHPSGRNRQINNMKFINKKLEECYKWLSKQE